MGYEIRRSYDPTAPHLTRPIWIMDFFLFWNFRLWTLSHIGLVSVFLCKFAFTIEAQYPYPIASLTQFNKQLYLDIQFVEE